MATGGDPASDTLLEILDAGGKPLAAGDDVDFQEDAVFNATKNGNYYVRVTPSAAGFFDVTHNTYQLFIEVK